MSILIDACHGSLQPQLKPQQRGNSLLIVCKFYSTCRDGVKEEPVKSREVSVYLRGKMCISGRHQQASDTNSTNRAGHCHPVTVSGCWPCSSITPVSTSTIFPPLFHTYLTSLLRSRPCGCLHGQSLPGITQHCWQFFLEELYPRAPHQLGCTRGLHWAPAQFRASSLPRRTHGSGTAYCVFPAAVSSVVLYPWCSQCLLPHKSCS